jgi:hypothetical protein
MIEWVSWFAQFPDREIFNRKRLFRKRYFPIGKLSRLTGFLEANFPDREYSVFSGCDSKQNFPIGNFH